MSEASQPTQEIPTQPFDGLEITSPGEQLALAEAWQQILDLNQPGSNEEKALALKLTVVADYMASAYPGYTELASNKSYAELVAESGLSKKEVNDGDWKHPSNSIGGLANAARWRLSGIDPATLPERHVDGTTKKSLERAWSEAAEARRNVELAELGRQQADLLVEEEMAGIHGQVSPTEHETYQTHYSKLAEQIAKLTRPGSSSAGAGWGSGVPTR